MSQSAAHKIIKNMGVMMASQLCTWGLSLLITVFFSRYLGAEGVGQFHLANSLWAIVAMFTAFGMDVLLTKEIARYPAKVSELFSTSLVLRMFLFGIGTIGLAFYLYQAGYPLETVWVIVMVGVTNLISQYAACADSVFRGLERMEFISIGTIVLRALWATVAILLLLLGYGPVVVISASIATAFIHFLLMRVFLNRVQPIQFTFNRTTAAWMLKSSYTYFFVGACLVLYMQVDTVIISLLVNEETIGWYAAADQLFGTLLFVPGVLMSAVFPAMARMHTESSATDGTLINKSFDLLLLLGVPIGLGTIVVAEQTVVLLLGKDFVQSAPVLAIFGLVLIFTYQNSLIGQYYISIDRQRFWTWVMAAALLATIPLDLVLVPWSVSQFGNGAIGGALSFVVTEATMLIVGLAYLPRGTLGWDKLWLATRVLVAGLLMVGATWLVRDYFIAVPVVVGAIVYGLFILLFQVVQEEDWTLLKAVADRVLGRFRSHAPQPANS